MEESPASSSAATVVPLSVAVVKTFTLLSWGAVPNTVAPSGVMADEKPDHIAVAFDAPGGSTYRIELDPEYKAGRKETPDLFRSQLPLIHEVLEVLEKMITTCNEDGPTIVMVGHQPWVGQLAQRLLTDSRGDMSMKKAAAWWLVRRSRDGSAEWTMKSVLDPDLV